MSEEQRKVFKYLEFQIRSGKDFEAAQKELFLLRESTSKHDREIYESFCFMHDEEWLELKKLFV